MIVEFYTGLEITAHPLAGLGIAAVVAILTLVLMRVVGVVGRGMERRSGNRTGCCVFLVGRKNGR